ncbi:hypothetical protein [Anthocerotibacter panamensis]|uniref:hypothetical protein n=1 Tax=Anthocerotibacter panamensis TaxID=2857077 RepID=UPI001C401AD3|nr:hypothetical protein [Anthocerotibacter panamensis]
MRDSVWTYLRRYRLDHPETSPEELQRCAQEAGYIIARPWHPAAAPTQFRCYDAVYERLKLGQTLSPMQVRQLCTPFNATLHQDERFFDLVDGSWYLSSQRVINDDLADLLRTSSERETDLAAVLQTWGGPQRAVFWNLDPRFQLLGQRVQLLMHPSELKPEMFHQAQAWLQDWLTREELLLSVLATEHPDLLGWQCALTTTLEQDERFIQVAPDLWAVAHHIPQPPTLEAMRLLALDPGPHWQVYTPAPPDPQLPASRRFARFQTTIGVAQVHLGYLVVPGLWQPAFQDRFYSVRWQDASGQEEILSLWYAGGLCFGEALHLCLLRAGVGSVLVVEKNGTDEIQVVEQSWDPTQEGRLFAPQRVQRAQTAGIKLWQDLPPGQSYSAQTLITHWHQILGRPLLLQDYQDGLLTPLAVRTVEGFSPVAVAWDAVVALLDEDAALSEDLASPDLPESFVPETGLEEVPAAQVLAALEDGADLFQEFAEADLVAYAEHNELNANEATLADLSDWAVGESAPELMASEQSIPSMPSLTDLLEPSAEFEPVSFIPEPSLEPLVLFEQEPLLADLVTPALAPSTEPAPALFSEQPVLSLSDLLTDEPLSDTPVPLTDPDLLVASTPVAAAEAYTSLNELLADWVEPPDTPTDVPAESIAATPLTLVDLLAEAPAEGQTAAEPMDETQLLADLLAQTPAETLPLAMVVLPAENPEALLLEPPIALADLLTSYEEPAVEAAVLPSWQPLWEQLARLETLYPVPTQAWSDLLVDLWERVSLSASAHSWVEHIWRGEMTEPPDDQPQIQAASRAFFKEQLALATLPHSGSLETLAAWVQTHVDCGEVAPGPALALLILPALGYRAVEETWIWAPTSGS